MRCFRWAIHALSRDCSSRTAKGELGTTMSDHSEYREEFTDERPQSYDHSEPSYTIIAALGVTTVIALIFIGIGVQFYYERTEEARVYEKVLSQPSWTLQDLRNKEAWELSHYTYLDKTKGTVRIPIDQAMTLVANEAAENQLKYPTNAYAVKTDAQLATSPARFSGRCRRSRGNPANRNNEQSQCTAVDGSAAA